MDDKVAAPKTSIWNKIRGEFKYKKTAKSIYNDALQWWRARKLENNGDQSESEASDSEASDSNTSIEKNADSDESYVSDSEVFPQADDISFTISLSQDIWETIKPTEKERKRNDDSHKTNVKMYHELEAFLWADVLVRKISKHRINNPCTWSFKRAKVYINGKRYVVVSAKCTTCGAKLFGEVKNQPNKTDEVKFKCIIRGFEEQTHLFERKNVRIGSYEAKELFKSKKPASLLK